MVPGDGRGAIARGAVLALSMFRARLRPRRRPAAASGRGALAALALLAGAAPAAEAPTACCTDPAAFRYQLLPDGGSTDFVIDRDSPSFEFQSGRSAFQAFALPVTGRSYALELRSFVTGPADPRRARVFYPVIAILTDDFMVSRTTELAALRFDLPVLERSSAPAYRVSLPVGGSAQRERYLVVFTPHQLAVPRVLPPIADAESAAEAARVAYLGAAPYGRLRITLRAIEPGAIAPPAEPPSP